MSELIKGIELTAHQVVTLHASAFFETPTLVYARSFDQ